MAAEELLGVAKFVECSVTLSVEEGQKDFCCGNEKNLGWSMSVMLYWKQPTCWLTG